MAVTGKSLVMKIKKSVLYLHFFIVRRELWPFCHRQASEKREISMQDEWEKAQTLEKRVSYASYQRCYHHFDGECIVYNFSPSPSSVSRVSCF